MRLITNPDQSNPQTQTQTNQPTLTPQLLDDLLDPTNTPTQICSIHGLSLTELTAIVNSIDFQLAIDQIQTINAARSAPIESNLHLQSKSVTLQIANAAFCAAQDIDELKASKDPNLARAKSTLLDTARKATRAIASPAPKPAPKIPPTNPTMNHVPPAPTHLHRNPPQMWDRLDDDHLYPNRQSKRMGLREPQRSRIWMGHQSRS